MITPGAGWRFQEHIATHELYEDQVVEHELTGHLAVRRVYASELLGNPAAADLLRGQARALASLHHPALPRFYGLHEQEGRLVWLFENLRGPTLRGQLRARGHLSAGRWAAAAYDLVELLRDLSRSGVSLSRLRLEDFVVLDETLRLATLAPAPNPVPADAPPILAALAADRASGVWHRGDPRRQEGESARLLDVLYHLAMPTQEAPLADGLAAHEAQQQQLGAGPRVHSVLGIEGPIEQVLLRFHHVPDCKWDELAEALMPLVDRGAPMESTHGSAGDEAFRLTRTPRSAPEIPGRAAEPVRPKQQPAPAPAAPAAPSSAPAGAVAAVSPDEPTPSAARRSSAEREVFARSEIRMEGKQRFEDDATEDRSYLIPEQRADEKTELVAQEIVRRRRSWMSGRRFVVLSLVTVVVVGGIVAAVVLLPAMLAKEPPPNVPPTALFTVSTQTFAAYQRVTLDATASTDPEGRRLLYSWQVKGLAPDQWRIEPNKTREAATPELQIYAEGRHAVELKVFDDSLYSLPVEAEVVVGPPIRQ